MHCSVQNAAVLCENDLESVTQFWTSLSEEEEEEEDEEEEEEEAEDEEGTFWLSGDFLVWYFHNAFRATGSVVCHALSNIVCPHYRYI